MSRLYETEVFIRVVEAGSFTSAAKKLSITKSYASKLVSRLEDRLGARLLHRTTRKLTLTEQGETYYERCVEALAALDEAEDITACLQVAPRGRIRITIPDGLGRLYLAPLLPEFSARYPDITLDVCFTNRHLDLVQESIDLAIRTGHMPDSTLVSRKIAEAEHWICASPDYLERRSTPQEPEDLREHDCIENRSYSFHTGQGRWELTNGVQRRQIRVSGSLATDSGMMMVQAALRGLGVVYLPEFYVARAIAEDKLVRVLPDWHAPAHIHIVSPSGRHRSKKVRLLGDFLAESLQPPPWR